MAHFGFAASQASAGFLAMALLAGCTAGAAEREEIEAERVRLEALRQELDQVIDEYQVKLFAYDYTSAYDATMVLGGGVDLSPQAAQMVANFSMVSLVVACRGYADAAGFHAAGVESDVAIETMIGALLAREDDQQLFVIDATGHVVGWFRIRSWSMTMPPDQIVVYRNRPGALLAPGN